MNNCIAIINLALTIKNKSINKIFFFSISTGKYFNNKIAIHKCNINEEDFA